MAKGKRKSAGGPGKKRGRRLPKRSWKVFIFRAMKQVNKELTCSRRAMMVVNSFVSDIFDRIATEAASLARNNRRRTLGSREVQTAVRLLLPTDLAKHAMSEATKALAKVSA
jgi:histone H2B